MRKEDLLPVAEGKCPEQTGTYGFGWVQCQRDIGHTGGHHFHNGEEGYSWTKGLGLGIRAEHYACPGCGVFTSINDVYGDRVYGQKPPVIGTTEGRKCTACTYWEKMLDSYLAGKVIVAGGTVYNWEHNNSGAFGDRKVIVHYNSGATLGPASKLWHLSYIPDEYLDVFTDNATLEWV